MINRKMMVFFLIVLSLVLAGCVPPAPELVPVDTSVALTLAAEPRTDTPTLTATFTLTPSLQSNASTQAISSEAAAGSDPQNATYTIEGQAVTLVDGVAEKELAPGSASKQVTSYFGNEVEIDLNSDGLMDSAFLLTQDSGGSGTFFYVAAAVNGKEGYTGTNAILLGDRIAPQSTFIDPDNPAQFIVSYGEIPAGEPMSSEPTQMVSRTFKLENGRLVEVSATPN